MSLENERHLIACLPGDGVGPEIMAASQKVLQAVADKFDIPVSLQEGLIGGAAIDSTGRPLPEETLALCKNAKAVLLGAVGGPKWDQMPSDLKPEKGLLALRKALKLYCNLRPVKSFAALEEASPLKSINSENPVNMLIVRELTGGIYFGERGESSGENPFAWDKEQYSKNEIRRIGQMAIELCQQRSGKLTSVDKANVLSSSQLWRKEVNDLCQAQSLVKPVTLEHMYVDNCAMQLILNPHQFDVILTSNLFGDILSDEASTLVGSIGLMPSASIGSDID